MSDISVDATGSLVPALARVTEALSPYAEPLVRVATRLLLVMTVAAIQVHLLNGFFLTEGGYEYPLLWGILALSFVIRGGGRFSLDALIGGEI